MEEQGDSAALPIQSGGSKDSFGLWCHDGHVQNLLFKASESRASLLKVCKEQSRGSHREALQLTPPLLSALIGSHQEIKEPGAKSGLLMVSRQCRHIAQPCSCGS